MSRPPLALDAMDLDELDRLWERAHFDTHGFGILDRVRAWRGHAESVLMDRVTLLTRRDRCATESAPTNAALTRFAPAERTLYEDLVTDRFGPAVRLEQERIGRDWALGALDQRITC